MVHKTTNSSVKYLQGFMSMLLMELFKILNDYILCKGDLKTDNVDLNLNFKIFFIHY